MQFLSTVAVAALLATIISAHPGHDVSHEIETRATFMKTSKRDLAHCVPKMRARGLYHSSIQRRAAVAKAARQKQNLATDALISRLVMKQPSSTPLIWWTEGYTNATDESMIFSGKSSCILSPVIQGPYYVSGEYVPENIIEDEKGVELILDTQVLDMATCDPVPNAMIEIWQCNATGVYTGMNRLA